MGVFGVGYGLSSMAIGLPFVLASFGPKSLTDMQSSLLTGSASRGMATGPIIFDISGNKGRKRICRLDVIILRLAARGPAFVPTVAALIGVPDLFGIWGGANYRSASTIMGEHANWKDRAKIRAAGFGFSGVLAAVVAGPWITPAMV